MTASPVPPPQPGPYQWTDDCKARKQEEGVKHEHLCRGPNRHGGNEHECRVCREWFTL